MTPQQPDGFQPPATVLMPESMEVRMPYQSEIDAEFSAIDAILDEYTKRVPEGPQGRICQSCGEAARLPSIEHEIAAYEQRGDFIAFWDEHQSCFTRACRGIFTGWRFCEVCRCETAATPENRAGLSWLCSDCREGLRLGYRGEGQVLEKLARWRGAQHGTFCGAWRSLPLNVPTENDVAVAIEPPGGWIPIGLRECPTCNWGTGFTYSAGYDGNPDRRSARCRCEIARCPCGARSTTGEAQTCCYSVSGGGWRYSSGIVSQFGRYCRDCLHEKGVKTTSYSAAIEKLPSDKQVEVEKLRNKWTVEDARRKPE